MLTTTRVDLDPNDYIAWHNRGIVLENLRRSEEALASYDYALEVNPNFAYTWYHRANLLLISLGNMKKHSSPTTEV
jgi:tetratricopeptide (TPR) repeat protein